MRIDHFAELFGHFIKLNENNKKTKAPKIMFPRTLAELLRSSTKDELLDKNRNKG